MAPLSGKTPQPPPPHDGNNSSLYDMAPCVVTPWNNNEKHIRYDPFSIQPSMYKWRVKWRAIYLLSNNHLMCESFLLQVSWRRWCARTPLLSFTVHRTVSLTSSRLSTGERVMTSVHTWMDQEVMRHSSPLVKFYNHKCKEELRWRNLWISSHWIFKRRLFHYLHLQLPVSVYCYLLVANCSL